MIYVSCLSCFIVCSLQPCGYLSGKGEPLGSLDAMFTCFYFVTLPCGVLGQVKF